MLKTISKVALPTIAQLSCVSVGNLLVQGLINDMGSTVMAGMTAGMRLSVLAAACMFCASTAFAAYAAQNIGAGRYDRIAPGLKAGFILSVIISSPFIAVYSAAPDFALGLFMKGGEAPGVMAEAMEVGGLFLRFVSPFYIPLAVKVLVDGVLRGSGALRPFVFATFADLFIRVLLAYILAPYISYAGIAVGWAVGWVIAAAMVLVFYFKGIWRDTTFSRKLVSRPH
jgi:Na+-driven multidrug efflux pump